jgi:DNA (cytosine-5)-methyltransferase 1
LPTVTTARGGELALVAPTLVSVAHGDSGGRRSVEIDQPLHTILQKGKHALVAAFMAQHNGGMVGHPMEKPVSTLTLGGCQQQVVAAHLSVLRNGMVGVGADEPVPTVTTSSGHMAAVAAHLTVLRRNSNGVSMDSPVPTITAGGGGAGGHVAAVAAFMVKYYGEGGQSQEMDQPVHTIPTRDRFGLVTVEIDGVTWVITDIGMRMLSPRELARAMSWPDSYQLAVPGPDGRGLSKSAQVARIGNGVASVWAAAHVRAALYLDGVAA